MHGVEAVISPYQPNFVVLTCHVHVLVQAETYRTLCQLYSPQPQQLFHQKSASSLTLQQCLPEYSKLINQGIVPEKLSTGAIHFHETAKSDIAQACCELYQQSPENSRVMAPTK